MIVEGLIVSEGADGRPHCAPMGPVVDPEFQQWLLRPFQTSQTFSNLQHNPNCVFHVVDNVLPVVRCILRLPQELPFRRIEQGWLLESACHWYGLQIESWDTSEMRSEARARRVAQGDLRPFWGWNRAKHAVLEAAILVTRLHLHAAGEVRGEFQRLRPAVLKTAGEDELVAWELLEQHLATLGKD